MEPVLKRAEVSSTAREEGKLSLHLNQMSGVHAPHLTEADWPDISWQTAESTVDVAGGGASFTVTWRYGKGAIQSVVVKADIGGKLKGMIRALVVPLMGLGQVDGQKVARIRYRLEVDVGGSIDNRAFVLDGAGRVSEGDDSTPATPRP